MQAKLEDPVALTRELLHRYYQGDGKPWLARLCAKSVWIGNGERVLVGGDAIREHFRVRSQRKICRIFQEEYYPLSISSRSAAVVAQLMVGNPDSKSGEITAVFTMLYQLKGTETKLMLTHFSNGFSRPPQGAGEDGMVWVPAYHLYRTLLADKPGRPGRLAVPSGGRTFYIHPDIILYAQSRNRRAELYCVDAVIRSDLTITELNALLPEEFYPIHRCYTVNSRHVSAIRRYQVTMVTGETLPIPAGTYNRVRAELDRRITGGTLQPVKPGL